jgi:peptidyl-prolyl cis-trans isomerase D
MGPERRANPPGQVGVSVNRLSQLFGAAAVIAIAVVFILQFRPASGTQAVSSGPTCAIEVGGNCISTQHFLATYRLVMGGRALDPQRARAMGLRRQVAEGLVERWLLVQDGKRLGIAVSDADVTAELASGRARVSLPVERAQEVGFSLGLYDPRRTTGFDVFRPLLGGKSAEKGFDAKAYEKEVRRYTQLSPADYREFQREEIIASRVRDLVASRVVVGESEAYDQFAHEKSTASISYVRLDKRFFAEAVVDTSEKAVAAWAEKNSEEAAKAWDGQKTKFTECRLTRHILAKIDELSPDPDAAKEKAKKKIEAIKKKLDAAPAGKLLETFAELARLHSDDRMNAVEGGRLGCVQKGVMVKPFEDTLFQLEEGKLSKVVETQFGYHVLFNEKSATGADAEKFGKDQVYRDRLLALETERLTAEGAKQILAAAHAGKSLEDATAEYLRELRKSVPASRLSADAAKDEKKGDEKKGDAPKDEKKPDEKKGDAPKDEKKGDAPKDEKKGDEKKGDEKKGDAKDEKKGDEKKGDAPKDEKKGDAPKDEKKPDEKKGDAPKDEKKGDEKKGDAPKDEKKDEPFDLEANEPITFDNHPGRPPRRDDEALHGDRAAVRRRARRRRRRQARLRPRQARPGRRQRGGAAQRLRGLRAQREEVGLA